MSTEEVSLPYWQLLHLPLDTVNFDLVSLACETLPLCRVSSVFLFSSVMINDFNHYIFNASGFIGRAEDWQAQAWLIIKVDRAFTI